MSEANYDNRRSHERVSVPTTAVLFQGEAAVGRYVVQNVSAGGALLTGRRTVGPQADVRLLLPLVGDEPMVLGARIKRRAQALNGLVAVAVAFEHESALSETAFREAVLHAGPRSDPEKRPVALVVTDKTNARETLQKALTGLGRQPVVAATPLDAVRVLEDPRLHVDAAFVDVNAAEASGLEILSFIHDEHPRVRRILLQLDIRPSVVDLMRASEFVHASLREPWDEATLGDVLTP